MKKTFNLSQIELILLQHFFQLNISSFFFPVKVKLATLKHLNKVRGNSKVVLLLFQCIIVVVLFT